MEERMFGWLGRRRGLDYAMRTRRNSEFVRRRAERQKRPSGLRQQTVTRYDYVSSLIIIGPTTTVHSHCNLSSHTIQPFKMLLARATPHLARSSRPAPLASSLAIRPSCSTLSKPSLPVNLRRMYATEPEPSSSQTNKLKDRQAVGVFNIRAALLFAATGAGLFYYFRSEQQKVAKRKAEESSQQKVGRPRIGGPFELVCASPDGKGYKVTHEDLEGAFSLIYFGFTNCPDICPEELDKMGAVVDSMESQHGPIINPIFISCDPARDSVPLVSTYISDFHPKMLGLTGSYEAVKSACKSYRVYFSTPPNVDPSSDYLVDHSIFFYLMDPEGRFVDAFGRSTTKEEVEKKVVDYVNRWKKEGLDIGKADLKQRVITDQSRLVK
ncbi:unnamed protein product [Sympodiomycopsis kandeliae]